MTDAPQDYARGGHATARSGWTGWITFAAIMMIIAGTLNALYGLIAVINDEWVVWGNRANLYLDISEWGWAHLVVGLIVLFSGIGLFSGRMIARIVAIIVAGVSLIANFFFIPAYPLWAIAVVVIDVLVIWALTAHGSEMKNS